MENHSWSGTDGVILDTKDEARQRNTTGHHSHCHRLARQFRFAALPLISRVEYTYTSYTCVSEPYLDIGLGVIITLR